MAKSSTKPWRYGDAAPKTWQETADILKANQKPVKKSSGLYERLVAIEGLLKEKKHG